LPNQCPASIYIHNRTHPNKLKAKIKYWIKARIVDLIDETDEAVTIAECKKDLTVVEEPPDFEFLMM
jgi:hypothetical protein